MRIGRLFCFIIALAVSSFLTISLAQAKRVEIVISKVGQKMTVKVDGSVEYVWPVSTGAAGYETPSGVFRPFRMEAEHFSKEWDDAPMPNSIFFTGEGHAIHGSFHVKSLGRKASHGCVRLAPENAAVLFELVQSAGMSNTSISLKGGFFDFSYQPKRSFASVGKDLDKAIGAAARRKPTKGFFALFEAPKPKAKAKKVVAKKQADKKSIAKKDPVKVAVTKAPAKCVSKDAKKPCKKLTGSVAPVAG